VSYTLAIKISGHVAYLIENVFLTLCKREMLWSGIVEQVLLFVPEDLH